MHGGWKREMNGVESIVDPRFRLQRVVRAASCVLMLSILLPFEVEHGTPWFVWELAAVLPWAAFVSRLLPSVVGLALFAASWGGMAAPRLAIVVAGGLATVFGVCYFDGASWIWDPLPLPESWTHVSIGALIALSLGVATTSPAVSSARRVRAGAARFGVRTRCYVWLVAIVGGIAVAHRPARAGSSPQVHRWQDGLGAVVLSLIILWPVGVVLAGWAHFGCGLHKKIPVRVVIFPLCLILFVYRSLIGWQTPAGTLTAVGNMVVLASVVALLSRMVSTVVLVSVGLPWKRERGTLWLVAGVVVVTIGLQLLLPNHERAPEVWRLDETSPESEQFFGKLLPRWNDAQRRFSLEDGTQDSVEEASAKAQESANRIDQDLGAAFVALSREVDDGGVSTRRWYARVTALNEASRKRGLPYYVDPTEVVVRLTAKRPWFRLDTWRIEAVGRFEWGGSSVDALHVRSMTPERGRPAVLGLTRDQQDVAIISLNEIERYARGLEELGRMEPPRCTKAAGKDGAASESCGQLLGEVVATGGLRSGLIAVIERHEVQHQLDGELPRAPLVLDRLGVLGRPLQSRVNRELSAHLAEMTTPRASARIGLVRTYRQLLLGGAVERQVAQLVLEALHGLCDGEACMDEAFEELSRLGDGALRERAVVAWGEQYGGELAAVRRLGE